MTPKPPKIGVTVLTVSGLDGYGRVGGGCRVWRKLRPGKRPVERLLRVLRYGVQRGCWLDWRIVFFDEASR
jgi:hypothetical protein